MKLYKVTIDNVAWFLIMAPESKPEWLESWIKRNVPEPIESIIWVKATEEDIAEYGNFYVWKLTDSFEDDDLGAQ